MLIKEYWYHQLLFKTSFAEIKELFPEKNQTLREIFYKIQVMAKIIYFFGFTQKKIASNQQLVFTGVHRGGRICIRPYPLALLRINRVPGLGEDPVFSGGHGPGFLKNLTGSLKPGPNYSNKL